MAAVVPARPSDTAEVDREPAHRAVEQDDGRAGADSLRQVGSVAAVSRPATTRPSTL